MSTLNETNKDWYATLDKSPLTPPSFLFGIVWPILYILIIISGILFFINTPKEWLVIGVIIYAVQWILNLTWSPLFFMYKQLLLSFIVIVTLLITIGVNIFIFSQGSLLSASLLIPYFIWVSFASYLNGYIVFNNSSVSS
jgi:tryptophan-rich sensory protein